MRKTMKKIFSVALSMAMVITSITTYHNMTVKAAGLSYIKFSDYNLAYEKTVISSKLTDEGAGKNGIGILTDGAYGAFVDTKHNEESYFIVDLGAYYETESIDRIVTIYQNTGEYFSGTSPQKTGYTVGYSANPYLFTTVKTVSGDILENAPGETVSDRTHDLDMENLENEIDVVRYVKISYPAVQWGTQLNEIAVFNDAGEAKTVSDVATAEIPKNVVAENSEYSKLTVSFDMVEGTKYVVIIDGQTVAEDAVSGAAYDVKKGLHDVLVIAYGEGMEASDAVEINNVEVVNGESTLEQMAADSAYNVALGRKSWIEENNTGNVVESRDGTGSVTDGIIKNTTMYGDDSYSTAGRYTAESFVIDLGAVYDGSTIEKVAIWFRDSREGLLPVTGGFKIQYSTSGDFASGDFVNVATVNGQAILDDPKRVTEENESYVYSVDVETTEPVRYVRIYVPTNPAWGMQTKEIAVIDTDGDLNYVFGPTVKAPTNITAESLVYGMVSGEIVPADGAKDSYTYMITLIPETGNCIMKNDLKAGRYTLRNVPEGKYSISVRAFYNGYASVELMMEGESVVVSGEKLTLEEMAADSAYNVAYKKKSWIEENDTGTVVESGEGTGSVTDGIYGDDSYSTAGRHTAESFVIDLGAVYDGSTIDKVAIWYRDSREYLLPVTGGFKVQYSTSGDFAGGDFVNVATVEGQEILNDPERVTEENESYVYSVDVETTEPVRYVRIYVPKTTEWGMQTKEIAVIDTNGDLNYAFGPTVKAPTNITAESLLRGISGAITPAESAKDNYTYMITLISDTGERIITSDLKAGNYTMDNVPEGTYSVRVRAFYNGYASDELVMDGTVSVIHPYTYTYDINGESHDTVFADKKGSLANYVKYANVSANVTSGSYRTMYAMDGNASTYWESDWSDSQSITIDLKNVYPIKEVDISWERAAAKTYDVYVSTDGAEFTKVAVCGADSGMNCRVDTIELKEETEARYVKITGTSRTTDWGYAIYEMAIYGSQMEKTGFYANVEEYKGQYGTDDYPKKEGYIFAGWYTDATLENVFEGTEGEAYARFVDEDILTAYAQFATDGTKIRFVSSVDDLNYQKVGFNIYGWYDGNYLKEKTVSSTSVYETLNSNAMKQEIKPKDICDDSKYFFTYAIKGMAAETASTWYVQPYWETQDGTTVYGEQVRFDVGVDGKVNGQ